MRLLLLILLSFASAAPAWDLGVLGRVAHPLQGPFSVAAPGFALQLRRGLDADGRWHAGLNFDQATYFERDAYVSARSLDLRLRRAWPAAAGAPWLEAGAGFNPMAWHYSNWPGWGTAALAAGLAWRPARGPVWELALGVQAFGPPERGLLQASLGVGPRWSWPSHAAEE